MLRKTAGALLALLVVASSPLYGQERFGSLTGRVTDQTAGALPGVTIVTTNRTSGEVRTFVTDVNGQFIAPDLAPGRYNVRFELTGFAVVERTDISVGPGPRVRVEHPTVGGRPDRSGSGHQRGFAARGPAEHVDRAQRGI